MEASAILQPVIVLGLLTIAITFWMFITRVPAMKRLRIHPQKGRDTSKLKELLPDEVTRISNNYNHLFEQPVLFYAIAISLAIMGHVDAFYVGCAWIYVGLRIAHSLVQATVDIVLIRFTFFMLSSLVLAVMVIREALTLFI